MGRVSLLPSDELWNKEIARLSKLRFWPIQGGRLKFDFQSTAHGELVCLPKWQRKQYAHETDVYKGLFKKIYLLISRTIEK